MRPSGLIASQLRHHRQTAFDYTTMTSSTLRERRRCRGPLQPASAAYYGSGFFRGVHLSIPIDDDRTAWDAGVA
jgi:hypothetical protein